MDYYTINVSNFKYIAHKSCTFDGKKFSNAKHALTFDNCLTGVFEDKCEKIDLIEKHTNFPIMHIYGKLVEKLYVMIFNSCLSIVDDSHQISFHTFDEFYNYVCIHYPHLIISPDIKIALK